jgi:RNA polymerase sigma-70 factor (ECF subfamily)
MKRSGPVRLTAQCDLVSPDRSRWGHLGAVLEIRQRGYNFDRVDGTNRGVAAERNRDAWTAGTAQRPGWIAGCCAREPSAIAAMFKDHFDTVERMIAKLVGPTPDLEDLVQTTFVEAIRSISRYRGEASFKTWITSVAVHVAQHHLRAGRLRRHAPIELVPEERLALPAPDIEAQLDERRLSARLHSLLDRIPPRQRVALVLFTIDGRPVEEVAALTGASQVTTRSRVFLGRRALRALIKADPDLSQMADSMLGGRRERTT